MGEQVPQGKPLTQEELANIRKLSSSGVNPIEEPINRGGPVPSQKNLSEIEGDFGDDVESLSKIDNNNTPDDAREIIERQLGRKFPSGSLSERDKDES